jgi:restriction system protein
MARRSSSSDAAGCLIVLLLIGAWWLFHNEVALEITGAAILLMVLFKAIFSHQQLRQAVAIVERHLDELTIRRKQLTATLNYGLVDNSKWFEEVDMFIFNVIAAEVGRIGKSSANYKKLRDLIGQLTDQYRDSRTAFTLNMDPLDYEHLVADRLRDIGWDTRLTKGSGDQGVDVIATMREKTVIIQCKKYSSPIGNSAVQEAYAGKSFENADFAAVVSNADYTSSARQLAESTRVLLLHHDELEKLEEAIFGTATWRDRQNIMRNSATKSAMSQSPSYKLLWHALAIAAVAGILAAVANHFR